MDVWMKAATKSLIGVRLWFPYWSTSPGKTVCNPDMGVGVFNGGGTNDGGAVEGKGGSVGVAFAVGVVWGVVGVGFGGAGEGWFFTCGL